MNVPLDFIDIYETFEQIRYKIPVSLELIGKLQSWTLAKITDKCVQLPNSNSKLH